ncbi:MAG: prepilin-type N-terminal cleavage/methylation domain-containing protein [Polaromonas sp.]|nr:prepilin-type N-terminal cleavage/methylation domain-containing protein [Polaromonas sp.]
MKKVQAGFTMIELVMVIVVLGVLSAVAIPKYVDFKTDAAQAAAKGVAGALESASAIQYAKDKLLANYKDSKRTCKEIGSFLVGGAPPTGFTIDGTAPSCTVANADSPTGTTPVAWTLSQD